ncbi:hypothetical protein BURMUCF2_A0510 [Burkholderia multivorans CF2]|nr:hypothetical protein BURMUCF2_A0510 [Burkholderia multivorans CF2]
MFQRRLQCAFHVRAIRQIAEWHRCRPRTCVARYTRTFSARHARVTLTPRCRKNNISWHVEFRRILRRRFARKFRPSPPLPRC